MWIPGASTLFTVVLSLSVAKTARARGMDRFACRDAMLQSDQNPCANPNALCTGTTPYCTVKRDWNTCQLTAVCKSEPDGSTQAAKLNKLSSAERRFGLCQANCNVPQPAKCSQNPCIGGLKCAIVAPSETESCWCYKCY
ncbi:hypothetical protein BJ741DRAFT_698085 [Chytriomyces cf. hyalinus JEL632]|nr:hypothetical protein BJ741DRAFT_698085 [Chytriomyces cf. hyalinus JEL632]